ncbi:MAG TPA: helix-turn-helix domain-containing protein [Gemmatimonadaceae bacterium]|jgi:predicted ArsR family transcriptional regulator|nr:helix-turn-helix domain-containing protein [Gemmatimonadaceae bacterium]
MPPLNSRLLESTRGRIVDLLRRRSRTVEELASELGVSGNAIRLQLQLLERDAVVRASGVRRDGGVGKPATFYEILPAAEAALSQAYLPFLSTLLRALGERLSPAAFRALMRDVGHRLAGDQPVAERSIERRVELASRLLNDLGGLTTIERSKDGGTFMIRGCSCPLGVAVAERKEVCNAVQVMLSDVVGADVREHCDRSERPQCCFEVSVRR